MKKTLLLLLPFFLGVSMLAAAQETNSADTPDKADVVKFLDLMHARTQMVQTLQALERQMKRGAEDGFRQKVPGATPEQLATVDHLFDGIFSDLPVDEMIDAIVPIYQKHFTKSDLAAITAFYSSPAGQKVLKEMPAIMSEAMEAGGEIGRRSFAAKSQELDRKIADLVRDTSK
ncbi:MAG TPA: DUF2059 domain-containing protein [Candidatus Aquilonibacter sp.]|nr:DUF2059 domain-containing protein [Candidatus Aquilonibacter sp.]